MQQILNMADYLIDGPYIESLRDITLEMRGSSNQRIINLREIDKD
jgi:anaerobic ribonucleoside-triphosphate reductase activating protein